MVAYVSHAFVLHPPTVARRSAAPTAAVVRMAAPAAEPLPLTISNVNSTLDQVRPYLISDGGNVEVVATDPSAMTVSLELVGACSSCPSSTTTMKMGIERVLKEQWPDLKEVLEVSSGGKVLTLETALEALAPIMPAIAGLGGSVRIVSAEKVNDRGKVTLEYTGPDKVRAGIALALKDSELIDDVDFA